MEKDKTNAMRLLDAKKIPYESFSYPPEITDGEAVAARLGEDARTVFKTLVTVSGKGEYAVFCVPVCASLDLKLAAKAAGVMPPYKAVGAGLRNADARMENARHECTCTLGDVARAAKAVLRFGGRLCICQRPERLTDAMAAFRENGVEPKRLRLVEQRQGSAPMLFLLEGRRGGKPGLEILPTLRIEAAGGGFSPEMLEIYGYYKTGHT